jgi:hypothetical protein
MFFGLLFACEFMLGCGHTVPNGVGRKYESNEARMERQVAEEEAELASRSYEERKLPGDLYHLLRFAERADSSERTRQAYVAAMQTEADGSGRIRVILALTGIPALDPVTAELKSLGLEVEKVGPLDASIVCWARPLDLRNIIAIRSVDSIRIPARAEHR